MTLLFFVLLNLIICDGFYIPKALSLREYQEQIPPFRNLRKRSGFGISSFQNFDPNIFVQGPSRTSFGSSGTGYSQNVQRVSKFDPNTFTMQVQYPKQEAGPYSNHKQVFDPNSQQKLPSASYNPNGEKITHYDPNEFVMPVFDPKEAASITFNHKKEPEPVFKPNNINFGGFGSSAFIGITPSPISRNWDGSWPGNKEADRSTKVGKVDPTKINTDREFGINIIEHEHEQTTARTGASWDGSWPGQGRGANGKPDSWNDAMTGKAGDNKAMESWNAAMSGRDEFSEKTSNAWNNAVNNNHEDLEKADDIIEHLIQILSDLG